MIINFTSKVPQPETLLQLNFHFLFLLIDDLSNFFQILLQLFLQQFSFLLLFRLLLLPLQQLNLILDLFSHRHQILYHQRVVERDFLGLSRR